MTGTTASPNTAASVKQRLLNLARKRGVEFNPEKVPADFYL